MLHYLVLHVNLIILASKWINPWFSWFNLYEEMALLKNPELSSWNHKKKRLRIVSIGPLMSRRITASNKRDKDICIILLDLSTCYSIRTCIGRKTKTRKETMEEV